MNDWWQWAGCISGIVGSLLLAKPTRWSKWGFIVYLLSNLCWIAYGIATKAPGVVVQSLAFTGTSLVGVWFWLVRPMVQAYRTKVVAG